MNEPEVLGTLELQPITIVSKTLDTGRVVRRFSRIFYHKRKRYVGWSEVFNATGLSDGYVVVIGVLHPDGKEVFNVSHEGMREQDAELEAVQYVYLFAEPDDVNVWVS